MPNTSLLSLLQLSDLTLPIGGYAHSNGLETYVQQGFVKDVTTAKEFVIAMLSLNLAHTDAAFVSLAYDAAASNNFDAVMALDDEATAVKLPKETRHASQKLGVRLIKIFDPVCSSAVSCKYKEAIQQQSATGHYAIAFGLYANAMHIPKEEALTAFFYNAAAGMVTNCVKLVPLGQQQGQELLFLLQPLIVQLVKNSIQPDKDMIGFCCTGFDIKCMQHEQLYSRLYMS